MSPCPTAGDHSLAAPCKGSARIAKHGGSGWYTWRDLKEMLIVEWQDEDKVACDCYCPPACECAIIAYALELEDVYSLEWTCCIVSFVYLLYVVGVVANDKEHAHDTYHTRLKASIALIVAVGEALENEARGEQQ